MGNGQRISCFAISCPASLLLILGDTGKGGGDMDMGVRETNRHGDRARDGDRDRDGERERGRETGRETASDRELAAANERQREIER